MRLRSLAAALAVSVLLAAPAGARAASRYGGTYTTTRPGVDGTQALMLVLEPGGRASLTTSYPELARRVRGVLPIRQTGIWRDRGATAEVRFTAFGLLRDGKLVQPHRDNNGFAFVLRRCRLVAVRYSKISYGEAGLTFDKSGCR